MSAPSLSEPRREQTMLNKVPEITLIFWVIKVLSTTVGETTADFLSTTLNLGLTVTSIFMAAALVAVLVMQLNARRYIPWIYWLTVVLVSIVGTLITDNLSDNLGVSLAITTPVFAIILSVTFMLWYARERTLSIHTIVTRRRELFYWPAILFTFALGTAAGDLMAERFNLGYFPSLLIFATMIGLVTGCHYVFKANAVLCFWLAYILTRPLGASCGDLLSQPVSDGGLGLGTTLTSAVFLMVILGLVRLLTIEDRRTMAPETMDVAEG